MAGMNSLSSYQLKVLYISSAEYKLCVVREEGSPWHQSINIRATQITQAQSTPMSISEEENIILEGEKFSGTK